MSAITWAAVVGLGLPDRLADGAASGRPLAVMSARATGCDGIRIATVPSPALTLAGIRGERGKIMVSGPGQKASASRRAVSGIAVTSGSISSNRAICTINGLSCGRPLASKIRATAASLVASAASPYTVSVGIPTSSPRCKHCAANAISSGASVSNRV